MCGIYGVVEMGGICDADRELLRRLSSSLVHRGPDGAGEHVGDCVGIGMRRLSIIDLDHGFQPLWNERHTIALVANGEVYNYVELRDRLSAAGHRFGSGSDCETIVHAYEEYGDEFLHHLRGMFAFALLDIESRRLILARDRLGEKPLYLHERGSRLVFTSELQSMVASGAVPFELDSAAIHDYLMWGFVPEPHSAVAGTRKLGPGHRIDIDLASGKRVERRWWDAMSAPPIDAEPAHVISETLEGIGRIISRSDVPVGVALSGGVDSNLVAALALRHRPQGIHAFTVGYSGRSRHDETHMAAQSARRLGIPHSVVRLEPDAVADGFSDLCLRRDEPIADISGSGYLALMRLSKDHGVPVLMLGQGGDELFWGYPWAVTAVRETIRKMALLRGEVGFWQYARPSRPPMSRPGLTSWLLGGFGIGNGIRSFRRDRLSSPDRIVFWDARESWQRAEDGERCLASDDFVARTRDVDSSRFFTGPELYERPDLAVTGLLLKTYLLGNGVNQCDRLSMACSVECRLPLIDYRLVEVAIGLQKAAPDWQQPRKQRLLSGARDFVPPEVYARRKRGFTPPWRAWMKAIFRKHGRDLVRGVLYEHGVVRDLTGVTSPLDAVGRPRELMIPLLILEQWARGMKRLASSAQSGDGPR